MRKIISSFLILILLLCGCTPGDSPKEETIFTQEENGNLVSNTGVEYEFLAMENGDICHLGEKVYLGPVIGEQEYLRHLGGSTKTGLYLIKESENDNILIRIYPNNEWYAIYRKVSLPVFDFTLENCSRLEFVQDTQMYQASERHVVHATCGEGITDKREIRSFATDIRLQPTAREAGYYEMITKPDGMLENCYSYGYIYGFFDEEPNLVIKLYVKSFNDLAYSVNIGWTDYPLSQEWMQKLQGH